MSYSSALRFYVLLAIAVIVAVPSAAYSGNGANFVLYNHHTAEAGEKEIMFMNDFAQEPDGTRYEAQMIEFELGITDRWTTEFMIEGQNTSGRGGYHFTGFRWENRYRLFEYGTFLNPVLYMEYESLGEDTKYLMEVSGREDAEEKEKSRPRERVFETRLILGQDITKRLDVAFNWINESDLDTGVTAFGYAAGLNYTLSGRPDGVGHVEAEHGFHPDVRFGVELYGGLGDSDKGITADADITPHYLGVNAMLHITEKAMVKLGGAIGLTNVSQDLVRLALGYEF
ncbi:MAG: hypothetical protein Q8P48_06040 [Deltaproteobacteria bacterium]|nr:hypothetical protein [Deltaproteobacteria bacterium]